MFRAATMRKDGGYAEHLETAAHSGHLEIARETLDGTTGIGLR